MRVKITIDCDNAAFDDTPAIEVARILQRYAAELRESYALEATSLYDVNGNRVGAVTVVEQGQRRQPGRGRE